MYWLYGMSVTVDKEIILVQKIISEIQSHSTFRIIETIARGVALHYALSLETARFLFSAASYVCGRNLPGVFIELGCCDGHTSVGLQKVINHWWKAYGEIPYPLHVVDSFAGLPEPTSEDQSDLGRCYSKGALITSPEKVKDNFAYHQLPLPQIHQGWFSEITDYPEPIAFAFLDGDLYSSILDGLKAVYPRLTVGAILCIHDYSYSPLPGVRKACDLFFNNKPEKVIAHADLGVVEKL